MVSTSNQNLFKALNAHERVLRELVAEKYPHADIVLENFLHWFNLLKQAFTERGSLGIDNFGGLINIIPNGADLDGVGFIPDERYIASSDLVDQHLAKILDALEL